MKNKIIRIIGIILIVIGISMTILPYIKNKKDNKNELIEIDKYLSDTSFEIDEKDIEDVEEDNITDNDPKTNPDKEILMILEIPKISFKRGIYNINSKYNNVKYNIQILKESNMPNEENGNLLIAGHNGNSRVSFFKTLNKLSLNDEIYIYYKGIKYTYIIDSIYLIEKDGQAEIYRFKDKNTITLVTCNRKDRTKQEIYIGYLETTENY